MVEIVEAMAEARAAGLDIRANVNRLIIRGPRREAHLAERLLARKAEVLELLAAEDAEVAWRVAAMRPQVPMRGPVPFLIARDVPLESSCCSACGCPLGANQRFRCQPCLQAATLVLDPAQEKAEE
jgi:hypothetical protein